MNEFPESNSMLDDLISTDSFPDANEIDDQRGPALEFATLDGYTPVDMRMLAAGDFAIIIGCLMKRLGLVEVVIPDAERQGLDSLDPSLCTVLICEADNSTQDVRFTLKDTPKSEFRP